MLWIAVCDDEVMECSRMATKIRGILDEMEVPCTIRQFYSGRELLQSSETFDIIFLDIIMDGLDGMKTARLVREKAFDKLLVFISASRDYVFDAYDVEAFQYLLKPVEDKKLKRVLQRAVRKTEERSQAFIIASRDRQKKKLFLDDIYYFEIRGRMIDAHGTGGIAGEGVCPLSQKLSCQFEVCGRVQQAGTCARQRRADCHCQEAV